jgi:hypothetical protein
MVIVKELIYEDDFLISEEKRIALKLIKVSKDEHFPAGIEFAVQYLYFKDGEWIQVARIDNQLHEGRPGVHIHILKREKVEWANISFSEAKEKIIELGEEVIKSMRGGQNDKN